MKPTKEIFAFALSLVILLLSLPMVISGFRTTSETREYQFDSLPPQPQKRYSFNFPDPIVVKSWFDVTRSPFEQTTEKKPMPPLRIPPPSVPQPPLPLPPTIPSIPFSQTTTPATCSPSDTEAILELVGNILDSPPPKEPDSPPRKPPPPGTTDTDTVRMKDQREFKGKIVYEDAEKVEIEIDNARIALPRQGIGEITRARTALDIYRERRDKLPPRDHVELFELARWCYEYGLFDQAVEEARHSLSANPDFLSPYLLLGDIFHEQGKIEEELSIYMKALTTKASNLEEVHIRLGRLYEMLGLEDKALEAYEASIQAYPGFPEGILRAARLATRLRKFEKAHAFYEEIASSATTNAAVLIGISELLLMNATDTSAFRDARDKLTNALILQPDSAEATELLGLAELGNGNFTNSASNFRKAIELAPWRGSAYSNLGVLLLTIGQCEHAAKAFHQALQRDPTLAVSHLGLGYISLKSGDFHTATMNFLNGLETDPSLPYAHFGLAYCYLVQNNFAEAASHFANAAHIAQDTSLRASAVTALAYVHLMNKKPLEAVRLCKEILLENPDAPLVLALGAIALIESNNPARAIEFLNEFAGDSKVTPLVLSARACAAYLNGNVQETIALLQKLVNEHPEDPYASKTLTAIEDHRSKLLWEDDFQRPDSEHIGRQWMKNEAVSTFVKIENGRLVFSGRQTRDWEKTAVERNVSAPKFAQFSVEIARPDAPIEFGLYLTVVFHDHGQHEDAQRTGPTLFFSVKPVEQAEKSPHSDVQYQMCWFWKGGGRDEEAKVLYAELPARKFVMSIERPDPVKPSLRLFLDDKELAILDAIELETAAILKLGIYTSAKRNTPINLAVTHAQVIERQSRSR